MTEISARKDVELLDDKTITDTQLEAATQVCTLVAQFHGQLEKIKAQDEDPDSWMVTAKERPHRVVLIEGSRGSGKTALLYTLLDLWKRRQVELRTGDEKAAAATVDQKKRDDELLPDFRKNLKAITGKVFPIGFIELPTVPEGANLLFQIVGQFRAIVDKLSKDAIDQDAKCELKEKFDQLLESAVLDSREVGKHLGEGDLENARFELDRIEKERLEIGETFAKFCDQLVKDFNAASTRLVKEKTEHPLFAIAIDDADLHFTFTIPALNLLRKLHHPNVMFLLTGDMEMFTYSAECEFKKEHPKHDLKDHAIRAVPQILEKLLPQAHRCEIRNLGPNEMRSVLQKNNSWESHLPSLWKAAFDLPLYEPRLHELLPRTLRMLLAFGEFISSLAPPKYSGAISQFEELDDWNRKIIEWLKKHRLQGAEATAQDKSEKLRLQYQFVVDVRADRLITQWQQKPNLVQAMATAITAGAQIFLDPEAPVVKEYKNYNFTLDFSDDPPWYKNIGFAFLYRTEKGANCKWPMWAEDSLVEAASRAREIRIKSGDDLPPDPHAVCFYLEICCPNFCKDQRIKYDFQSIGQESLKLLRINENNAHTKVLLLAAPESGLPDGLCDDILRSPSLIDHSVIRKLREMRKQQWEQFASNVRDDHPWIRIIGPNPPPPPEPASPTETPPNAYGTSVDEASQARDATESQASDSSGS